MSQAIIDSINAIIDSINRGSTHHKAFQSPTYVRRGTVITLCGSTRFKEAYEQAAYALTLSGAMVFSIGCDTKTDEVSVLTEDIKLSLDDLHFDKIDLSDEILVLNVGGYVGYSTKREMTYAYHTGKIIRTLEPMSKEISDGIIKESGNVVRTYLRK